MSATPKQMARVDAHVARRGPDECWIWQGEFDKKGSPRLAMPPGVGTPRRIIWEREHGPLTRDRIVKLRCGNLTCLNPAHMMVPGVEEKFWSRVEKTDTCWNWTGAKNRGYGAFYPVQGDHRIAHRYSWELAHGKIEGHVPGHPELEVVVMHKCDNRACVRPDHLELGTDATNVADMWKKGRSGPQKAKENDEPWGRPRIEWLRAKAAKQ